MPMAVATAEPAVTMAMAIAGSAIALPGVLLDDADGDVTLDEATLAARRLAECGRSEAVEVAHGAGSRFVEERDGVGGEELAVAAGAPQAHADVLGGVVGRERRDLEAVVQARV